MFSIIYKNLDLEILSIVVVVKVIKLLSFTFRIGNKHA